MNNLERACKYLKVDPEKVISHKDYESHIAIVVDNGILGCPKYTVKFAELDEAEGEAKAKKAKAKKAKAEKAKAEKAKAEKAKAEAEAKKVDALKEKYTKPEALLELKRKRG